MEYAPAAAMQLLHAIRLVVPSSQYSMQNCLHCKLTRGESNDRKLQKKKRNICCSQCQGYLDESSDTNMDINFISDRKLT